MVIFTETSFVKRFVPLLAVLSGSLLLWAGWPVSPFTLLIFVAWVPLLWIADHVRSSKKFFGYTYLHMLLWNLLVTWWVWNASLPGALGAFFANSLIMCVPWILFRQTRKALGNWVGYISLIIFWLAFEYLHHNWELSWPWLTLGNAFAAKTEWVQWYEYTGATGGSLWVLVSNILLYHAYKVYSRYGRTRYYYKRLAAWAAILILPILLSAWIRSREQHDLKKNAGNHFKTVVVVQPNVDPYTEKFTGSVESQIQKLIHLSESQVDSNTTLVVWPETAIPVSAEESTIKQNRFYYPVWDFLQRHPQICLLTGINSYRVYGTDKSKASSTARQDKASGIYYDEFNTAAFFDADTNVAFYHKAKLVPGVETLPSFLNFMSSWFEDFGGISGTLGRDKIRKVFAAADSQYRAAPVICYESIYSDYITEYIRKGANVLTIITNDGWWGNTPGYRQHMNYGRLRSIETRKWIARSANTGISCFIDPVGNVLQPQPWDTAAAIKMSIPVSGRLTFYVRYGDMLARACTGVAILLAGILLFLFIKRKIALRN